MKKIYIVLTQTGTILSRTVKLWTGKKYNHVSIALDDELEQLYSFGRIYPNIAFIGGFVHEGIQFGTFKKFYKTETKIYEKEVSDEQYEKIKETIAKFEENKSKYGFNVKGLVLAGFNKGYNPENKFYCSQFVTHVMKVSNIDITKIPKAVQPQDLEKLDGLKLIYKGKLRLYPEFYEQQKNASFNRLTTESVTRM